MNGNTVTLVGNIHRQPRTAGFTRRGAGDGPLDHRPVNRLGRTDNNEWRRRRSFYDCTCWRAAENGRECSRR